MYIIYMLLTNYQIVHRYNIQFYILYIYHIYNNLYNILYSNLKDPIRNRDLMWNLCKRQYTLYR